VVAPETRTIVLEVLFNYTLTILHLLELDFRVWLFRSGATYRFAQASPPWVSCTAGVTARKDWLTVLQSCRSSAVIMGHTVCV